MTREKPVSQLAEKAREDGVFDGVWNRTSAKGQHGIFVHIIKRPYHALIRVESKRLPKGEGYAATEENPTRISYLSIHKEEVVRRRVVPEYLGVWDTDCCPPAKHRFEVQARKDPKLKDFLEKIVEYFN